ncbi:GNAT family N-acetyltransferase [Christensenellaceae bacterium OttesenSCG-928-L17]|nr:GNAT family N-acetyltransferase [Christensenellaceae bacterium OttesenSCG-928-L17]
MQGRFRVRRRPSFSFSLFFFFRKEKEAKRNARAVFFTKQAFACNAKQLHILLKRKRRKKKRYGSILRKSRPSKRVTPEAVSMLYSMQQNAASEQEKQEAGTLRIREYRTTDNGKIVDLFYNTVRAVNAKDYNLEQVAVWAPDSIDVDEWCKPFAIDYTRIAEIGDTIVGFANIDNMGCFDRLYVHKDYQGMGIAKELAIDIENHARQNGVKIIKVDASITAKPFFERCGYTSIRQNAVKRGGQTLINYTMQKQL